MTVWDLRPHSLARPDLANCQLARPFLVCLRVVVVGVTESTEKALCVLARERATSAEWGQEWNGRTRCCSCLAPTHQLARIEPSARPAAAADSNLFSVPPHRLSVLTAGNGYKRPVSHACVWMAFRRTESGCSGVLVQSDWAKPRAVLRSSYCAYCLWPTRAAYSEWGSSLRLRT